MEIVIESEEEKFLDGFQAYDYDLFFTNKRILLIEDFASKHAGLLGIFGGVIGYGIAKAISSGKRTSHDEMFKTFKGRFDVEISLSDIKKLRWANQGDIIILKLSQNPIRSGSTTKEKQTLKIA